MLQDEDSLKYVRALEKLGKSPISEVSQISKSVTKIYIYIRVQLYIYIYE